MGPDPNHARPNPDIPGLVYIKNVVKNPNIIVGNSARVVKKRFDDEMIDLLEKFRWWDKDIEEINDLIPVLSNSNMNEVKSFIRSHL